VNLLPSESCSSEGGEIRWGDVGRYLGRCTTEGSDTHTLGLLPNGATEVSTPSPLLVRLPLTALLAELGRNIDVRRECESDGERGAGGG
jgi:hypothetical protein